MKIIPIQTSDLRSIIITKKKYSELYSKYEKAYQDNSPLLPLYWYKKCVQEKTKIDSMFEDSEMAEYADKLMEAFHGISVLTLAKECIEKFGEKYFMMKTSDWYSIARDYMIHKSKQFDFDDTEEIVWSNVAES